VKPEQSGSFPDTHWSVVLAAADGPSERSSSALESLCRTYWPPLYSYLRRNGCGPERAEDLVQGFIARLLARNDLASICPSSGRFRSYLLTGLRNFLVSDLRHQGARRRGGGALVISVDDEEAGLSKSGMIADGVNPELAFDRRWAQAVIEASLQKMERECYARGKQEMFETLKPCLAGAGDESYTAAGQRLGLSRQATALAVHRLRLRLRELVRNEVMQTVGTAGDAREEMRHMMNLWQE
jgi:RNA polymerase sigma-70 factor (ECF subfamily)